MSVPSGTRLGPYEIQAPIDKGGMGEVYRATDSRLGRDVAIKVLPQLMVDNPDALKRFEKEARALASLSHPNILSIHDVGRDGSISYVVMELLEGETLRNRLRRTPLTIPEILEIGIQILRGLSAAHANGVVHRDLKPENIFLTADGQVKVLDFGLAKFAPRSTQGTEDAITRSAATEPGTIMGTVPYMSPEQLRGETVDARADLFSFGVVLYEMVAGQRPFIGKTTSEIIAAILKDHPRETNEIRAEVPANLNSIIQGCLNKEREQRFQSASEVATKLKEVFSPGSETRAVSPKQKQSFLLYIGALLVAALILAVVYFFNSRPGPEITSLAILPFHNASGDPDSEYVSDGITESLINNMSKVTGLRIIARTTAFRYKQEDVNPQKVGGELRVQAVLTGKVQHRGDDLTVQVDLVDTANGSQIWGERYTRKLSDLASVEQEIASRIADHLKTQLSREAEQRILRKPTENAEAYRLYLKGRYHWNQRTEEGLLKARDYFQQAIDQDPSFAGAYSGLADIYLGFFDYEMLDPEEATRKSMAAALKAIEIDPNLGEAHSSLAHAYLHEWKWSDADTEFKRAIELDPGYATTYHWYALGLTALGRTDEAIGAMRKALELDPLSLRISADLGMALLAGRRYDEAIRQETNTLDMDPGFRVAYWIRGMALEGKGQFAEAIEQFQEALRRSPNNPNYLAALGHAYGVSGRKEEAMEILKQLQALPTGVGANSFYIALVYTGIGERDEAIRMLETSIQDRSGSVRYLKIERRLDPLRSDPRYSDLIRKVGLPPDVP